MPPSPGAFLPLHHLHRLHHAALPAVARCGAERDLLAVPHRGPHHLQQQEQPRPGQPGKNLLS